MGEPRQSPGERLDVVVVGGGPGGLSAALWLGRYGRRALVLDEGTPRNAPTWAVHGFPGLPDLPPSELRERLTEQCLAVGVRHRQGRVAHAQGAKDDFLIGLEEGTRYRTRRILLAYGRKDLLPDIPGLRELFGSSVFHCPDCDGPGMLGHRVGVIGADRESAALALYLCHWADSTLLLTNGREPELDSRGRQRLERNGIRVCTARVVRVHATSGRLSRVGLEGSEPVPLDGIFVHPGTVPGCELAGDLGCACDAGGHITVDHGQETTVGGVYAAGDITGMPYLAVSAAAEGVRAALSLHRSLLPEDLHL